MKKMENIRSFFDFGFSWGGWLDNRKGEWWLLLQLLIISANFLFLFTPIRLDKDIRLISEKFQIIGLFMISLGIILSLLSLFELGKSLSPLPEPKRGASLVVKGLYAKCRHPIYRGLIVLSVGIFLFAGSLVPLSLSILLIFVLIRKARIEETKLVLIYPSYLIYSKETYAIFPYLPFLDWKI